MKSEFYWGLFGSLIIAMLLTVIQNFEMIKTFRRLSRGYGVGLGFTLLPFVGIYFIVGVIMLFNKKSEKFAKGLLLSALILLFIMIFVSSGLI
jgi:TctA family transporter